VRRKPYSVLLLDEIEKAHTDVFNILLQILDEGHLTDSQGRTVNFKHTVIIMTSNLGADRIQAHARRKESFESLKEELMGVLRQSFRPELLNRIDDIIVFHALDRDQLKQITRLMLDRVVRRMRAQHVELEVSDEAVEYLANAGFDPEYGARPMRRAIQRLLEDELSEQLLSGYIEPGQRVTVGLEDGRLRFDVLPGEEQPTAEAEKESVVH
jgi:ATP-dependent Clp protease ATP-binding subunit ClpC